jgi:hypothetical protein
MIQEIWLSKLKGILTIYFSGDTVVKKGGVGSQL